MRINARFFLQVVCAAALTLAIPVTPGATTLLTAATPADGAADAPMVPGGSVNDCYWCFDFSDNTGHTLSPNTCPVGSGMHCRVCDETDINGETAPCHPGFDESGLCQDKHRLCEMTRMSNEDNAALLLAIRREDVQTMKEIIQSHPGTLRVNEVRNMLQWFDCSGSVHSQVALLALLVAQL